MEPAAAPLRKRDTNFYHASTGETFHAERVRQYPGKAIVLYRRESPPRPNSWEIRELLYRVRTETHTNESGYWKGTTVTEIREWVQPRPQDKNRRAEFATRAAAEKVFAFICECGGMDAAENYMVESRKDVIGKVFKKRKSRKLHVAPSAPLPPDE
jgi:hypothetical protein